MKKLFPILGIVCGIVCCILGIVLMDASVGVYADSASFGGDFYTYSVKATAAAANNVRHLAEAVVDGFGYLLLAIGLTDICLFGCKLTKASAPKAAPAMPQTSYCFCARNTVIVWWVSASSAMDSTSSRSPGVRKRPRSALPKFRTGWVAAHFSSGRTSAMPSDKSAARP